MPDMGSAGNRSDGMRTRVSVNSSVPDMRNLPAHVNRSLMRANAAGDNDHDDNDDDTSHDSKHFAYPFLWLLRAIFSCLSNVLLDRLPWVITRCLSDNSPWWSIQLCIP